MSTFDKDLLDFDGLTEWQLFCSHMFTYNGISFKFIEDDTGERLELPDALEQLHDELFEHCHARVPEYTIVEWQHAEFLRWLKKHKPEVITECIALMKIQES